MIHIWKVEGDRLELNKEELLQYQVLAHILERDNSPNKDMANKEFRYINFIADKNGYCIRNGLNAKEAHAYALQHSKLPSHYNPDIRVKEAIKLVYNSLNSTVVERSLISTISALHNSSLLMEKMKDMLEQKIRDANTMETIDAAVKLIESIKKQAKELPTAIKTLLELEKLYTSEKKGGTIRGGLQHLSSYDGDESLGHFESSVDRVD